MEGGAREGAPGASPALKARLACRPHSGPGDAERLCRVSAHAPHGRSAGAMVRSLMPGAGTPSLLPGPGSLRLHRAPSAPLLRVVVVRLWTPFWGRVVVSTAAMRAADTASESAT